MRLSPAIGIIKNYSVCVCVYVLVGGRVRRSPAVGIMKSYSVCVCVCVCWWVLLFVCVKLSPAIGNFWILCVCVCVCEAISSHKEPFLILCVCKASSNHMDTLILSVCVGVGVGGWGGGYLQTKGNFLKFSVCVRLSPVIGSFRLFVWCLLFVCVGLPSATGTFFCC